MTPNEFQQGILRTWNTDRPDLSRHEQEILNAALGLAGEAGEVANTVKKMLFYGRALDENQIADEIGDVLFYSGVLAHLIGHMLDAIMQANADKLVARHGDEFNQEHYTGSKGASFADVPKTLRQPKRPPAQPDTYYTDNGGGRAKALFDGRG